MSKIIQITTTPKGDIIALGSEGELFCGFFVNEGPAKKPSFGWRQIPDPHQACEYQYKTMIEPTEKQLEENHKLMLAEEKKRRDSGL